MLVTSKRTKHLHNLPTSITIGNVQIPFKQSVKNLGFTLDCHLTMNAHVSNIARTCYFELRRLSSIHRFLTSTATATLVSAFVLSRIDYCNSLLFGSTHDVTSHLQRIQNYAARVILRLPKSFNVTLGDRLFSFASSVWNSIPNDVRCAPSLLLFKSCLKIYLFCSDYKD